MIAARCTGCGAGLDPRSSASGLVRCSYCGVTHHAPVGPTQLRAAIREELVVDRNLNGVPDVLEQRPPAVLLPVAGPHRRSASVAWALGAGMAAVVVLGAVGAAISLRAPAAQREPHLPSAPTAVTVPAAPEPTPVPPPVALAPPTPAPKPHGASKPKAKAAADTGKTDVSPLALCKAQAASICAYDNEGEDDCIRARARCNGM